MSADEYPTTQVVKRLRPLEQLRKRIATIELVYDIKTGAFCAATKIPRHDGVLYDASSTSGTITGCLSQLGMKIVQSRQPLPKKGR